MGIKPTDQTFSVSFEVFFSIIFDKQSISLLHRSFKYRDTLFMANCSYNRNVKVLNFTGFFFFYMYIIFLKMELVENWIITTDK